MLKGGSGAVILLIYHYFYAAVFIEAQCWDRRLDADDEVPGCHVVEIGLYRQPL